jgi:hypothetical protein
MRHKSLTRTLAPTALTVAAGAFAATAMAAQPLGPGTYSGTTKQKDGYASVFVDQSKRIFGGTVTYGCPGKAVNRTVSAPNSFRPVKLTSRGGFVLEFRGEVRNFDGERIGKARVRITGRFRTRRRAPSVARVTSPRCRTGKLRFVARGPRQEG